MEQTPLQNAIRERAYVIWQEHGRPHGNDVQNWLQAETELAATAAVSETENMVEPRDCSKASARRSSSATRRSS